MQSMGMPLGQYVWAVDGEDMVGFVASWFMSWPYSHMYIIMMGFNNRVCMYLVCCGWVEIFCIMVNFDWS
jgi:hypothetical protein